MEPVVLDLDSRRDGIQMPAGWKPLPPSIGPEARPTGDELPSYTAPAVDTIVEPQPEQIDRPPQTIEMPPGWVPLPGAGIADMSEGWAQRLLAAAKARKQRREERQNVLKERRKIAVQALDTKALDAGRSEASRSVASDRQTPGDGPGRREIDARSLESIGSTSETDEEHDTSPESFLGKSISANQARKLGIEVRGRGPFNRKFAVTKPKPLLEK